MHWRKNFPIIAFFIVCGILLYSNTFTSSFHYDDYSAIAEKPQVQWDELSCKNIKELLITESDRPLSYLTLALNYYYGGLDVRGYHYVNIGIHILAAIGLFLFLKTLLSMSRFGERMRERSTVIAFISALFWFSSPIQIQSVTYIVQRMASLAAMFYIYAMYFYLKGRMLDGKIRYLFYSLTLAVTLLAFGSKQNAYTLPFYLLLLEIIIVRGSAGFLWKKTAIIAISCLVLMFLAIIWFIYIPPLATEPGPWLTYQIKTRFLTGMRVINFYITQLLFPVPSRLSLEHDFQVSRGLFDPPSTIFSIVAICSLVSYALISFKRLPLFSFFTLWFFGNLVLETFNPYLTLVFEHRLYLPSMGFFVFFVVVIDRLLRYYDKSKLLLIVALITFFSINTYLRNFDWKDEYSLWSDVIKKSPNIAIGYFGVANAYDKGGYYEDSLSNYLKAVSISPRSPAIRYGLGIAYFKLKRYEEARKELNYLGSMGYIGLESGTRISYYFSQIAEGYLRSGKIDEARNALEMGLSYEPDAEELIRLRERMRYE